MIALTEAVKRGIGDLIFNYCKWLQNTYKQNIKMMLQAAHTMVKDSFGAQHSVQDLCKAALHAAIYHDKKDFEDFLLLAAQGNMLLQFLSFFLNELNYGYIHGLFSGAQHNLFLSESLHEKQKILVQFIEQHQQRCLEAEPNQRTHQKLQNCLDCWMLLCDTERRDSLINIARHIFGQITFRVIEDSRIKNCCLRKGVIFVPPGDICRYQYRLCTFASFPGSYRTHVELARAGFYYIGKKHEVTCGWCESRVEDWAEGDDPRSRYWHNTGCMMLTQRQDWVQGDDPRSRDRYNTDRMILAQVDHSSVASQFSSSDVSNLNLDELQQNSSLDSSLARINESQSSTRRQQNGNAFLPARRSAPSNLMLYRSDVRSSSLVSNYESDADSAVSQEAHLHYVYE